MGNTHFDPTGEKKARKKATFKGAVVSAVFNVFLGVILGIICLSISAPVDYKPKPDAQTGKVAPPPAGLFYWAGLPGGDFHDKESQFLAEQPGGVTVSDGELNSWAATMFKSDVGQPKTDEKKTATTVDGKKPVTVADKAKAEVAKGVETAAEGLQTWGIDAGTPNFHAFKDPAAPAGAPASFQIAVPMAITLFGIEFDTIYQARGVFVAGSSGPKFKPDLSYLGKARIPVQPGLAQLMFNIFADRYTAGDDLKKYADAWARLPGVGVQDGALVLGGK